MSAYINGTDAAIASGQYGDRAGDQFAVGSDSPSYRFDGVIDELFVSDNTDLTPLLIRKIWACGADGSLCRCLADETSSYLNCGRAEPDGCGELPECVESIP